MPCTDQSRIVLVKLRALVVEKPRPRDDHVFAEVVEKPRPSDDQVFALVVEKKKPLSMPVR